MEKHSIQKWIITSQQAVKDKRNVNREEVIKRKIERCSKGNCGHIQTHTFILNIKKVLTVEDAEGG